MLRVELGLAASAAERAKRLARGMAYAKEVRSSPQ